MFISLFSASALPIFKENRFQAAPFSGSFCKSRLYKTNEAEIGEKVKRNLEHFETGKCKDKK